MVIEPTTLVYSHTLVPLRHDDLKAYFITEVRYVLYFIIEVGPVVPQNALDVLLTQVKPVTI